MLIGDGGTPGSPGLSRCSQSSYAAPPCEVVQVHREDRGAEGILARKAGSLTCFSGGALALRRGPKQHYWASQLGVCAWVWGAGQSPPKGYFSPTDLDSVQTL